MTTEELLARVAIEHTMGRYVRAVDGGRVDELAALFTDPMYYDLGGGNVARTHDELRTAVEGLKVTLRGLKGRLRHHVSSVSVQISGASVATATSAFIAITGIGPDHWGIYRDELRMVGNDWLFTKRVVLVEGAAPGSPVVELVKAW